nr:hypothetical protein [Tanacetum cinerariifolium]
MPNEAVKQGMDDHVPDEIDDAKSNRVVVKQRWKNYKTLEFLPRLTGQQTSRINAFDLDKGIESMKDKGMDGHVPDEIDGAKYEQLPNHVVKKDNLEFLVCKQ